MFKTKVAIFLFMSMFSWFAISEECSSYKNPIEPADDIDVDSSVLCDKIWSSLTINQKTIKWRRTFLCALISIILIFVLVHQRVPEPQELILYLIILYSVWYLMWDDYTNKIEYKSVNNSKRMLSEIKRRLAT